MQHIGFADLVADSVERRQRRHGLLEDHRDAAATDRLHGASVRRQRGNIGDARMPFPLVPASRKPGRIVEKDLTAGDPRNLRQDAHHRLGDGGFAGSRLADDGNGFRGPDGE